MPDYIKQLKIGNNNYNIKAEKAASPNSNAAVLRNISYGTGSPSGGSDGDIYIQYNTTSTHPFLDLVYPVGAIYLSTVNTNPGTLFGGTWSQIKDRFLLAAGDTYAAGGTGGEANHTLTVDEMPSHRHSSDDYVYGYPQSSAREGWDTECSWVNNGKPDSNNPSTGENGPIRTSYVGGGQPHNNMPPYLTVYVWKRTA